MISICQFLFKILYSSQEAIISIMIVLVEKKKYRDQVTFLKLHS